jgi:kynurenine formamidase
MNSGWSAYWEDPAAFVNLDAEGVQHYPGFHPDAADMLVNQRDIVGIAVDTLSQDPGNSTDFGTHITILGAGKYAIEGLANVGQMDPTGGLVYVGAPKHVDASGGPARVSALTAPVRQRERAGRVKTSGPLLCVSVSRPRPLCRHR